MNHKILLGLTTTLDSDYKAKVEEINKFELNELALFLTAIGVDKRRDLYALLEQTSLKEVPHVHLRNDAQLWECEYLVKRFNTQVFNIHGKETNHPFLNFKEVLGSFLLRTYIENTTSVPTEDELEDFGGLCIDFSHWQDYLLQESIDYNNEMLDRLKKFSVGCSHVSAVENKLQRKEDVADPKIIYEGYSKHMFSNLKEFDYLNNFVKYLPSLISLELENSFEEQLKAKKYIEQLIK